MDQGWAAAELCWRKGLSEVGVSWRKEPALEEGPPAALRFRLSVLASPDQAPHAGVRDRAKTLGTGRGCAIRGWGLGSKG